MIKTEPFLIAVLIAHNGSYMKRSDRMGAMISYTVLPIEFNLHSI